MSKTINSLINEALTKQEMWVEIYNDKEALVDREKTKEEALCLANYFEGKFDALCEARTIINVIDKKSCDFTKN